MTDKQIKEVFKNGFYCIEPCPEIKELIASLKAKEQECERLKNELIDIKWKIESQDIELNDNIEQLDQLKKENKELKRKNANKRTSLKKTQFHISQLKADNKHLNDLLNQALKELEQSREAIEKIKEIAKKKVAYFPDGEIFARPEIEQILQICDEVKDE